MKMMIIGSLAYSLTNFRGELIRRIIHEGHDVIACAPDEDATVTQALSGMGARFKVVPMGRASLNPIRDLQTICALLCLLWRERPDVILAYTQKPVIYTGIAHRVVRRGRFFPMVTGLGYAFSEGNRRRWLRFIVANLYRVGIARASSVILYNGDDLQELVRHGVVTDRRRIKMVPGSGVDVDHFARQPVPPGNPVFLLIARLLHDKGLHEYVAAARMVRKAYPGASFQLVGPFDANPASISQAELDSWRAEGSIEYLGATRDVRPFLAACSVFVLPSYREGMPRTILEAMATGRAIITTDAPGCRDAISDTENGYIVPVRNAEALAEAMMRFCRDPSLAQGMGEISRRIAEQRFAVNSVNQTLLDTMGLLRQARGSAAVAPPGGAVMGDPFVLPCRDGPGPGST